MTYGFRELIHTSVRNTYSTHQDRYGIEFDDEIVTTMVMDLYQDHIQANQIPDWVPFEDRIPIIRAAIETAFAAYARWVHLQRVEFYRDLHGMDSVVITVGSGGGSGGGGTTYTNER